ncbi:unnamed protein product [Blepharisma stoltei]|uniref:Thioredoxin domain-containing protein n=1 Tax=Blepharisma stoltei TaxID=1481888 RepID=A0AAU9JFK6_9CILI|nr:unnamed protein product [Blepharisma stoltei]
MEILKMPKLMKTLTCICLMLPLVYSSDLLLLDSLTIQDAIKEHENIMIEFYAPWCIHCKAFAPHYEQAATQLKLKGENIVMATIDGTSVPSELAAIWDVRSYPSLLFFKGGKFIEKYIGPRVTEQIVDYLIRKSKSEDKNDL